MLQAGASSSVIKRKITTTTVTTMNSLGEQRKEKRVYDLPGQKHEPPEEVSPELSIYFHSPAGLQFFLTKGIFSFNTNIAINTLIINWSSPVSTYKYCCH